jgi:FAD/FMN-containing dehydrogenase
VAVGALVSEGQGATKTRVFPEKFATLESDLKVLLSCGVEFVPQARTLFARAPSNYCQVLIEVVTPKTCDDAVTAVRVCREHGEPARGGSTSLAGQRLQYRGPATPCRVSRRADASAGVDVIQG